MKKFLVLLITIAMVFTLSGCGDKDVKNDKKDEDKNKVENNGGSSLIDYDAVNPELKAFYDDYEAFMDEYIAFVNSYKEQNSPISMLNEYMEFMKKINEFTSKSNEYSNNDKYNNNDAAFILERSTKIYQKLLTVSEQ